MQTADRENIGVIMLASLFGLLGGIVFLLARDVSGMMTVDLRLYQEDGTPVLLRPPASKGGYHLFVSHCWRYAQDQAATIKAMLTLMLPECKVFLDVDNLKSIAMLETYIAESDVICIFLTRSYLSSANCLRELVAAVEQVLNCQIRAIRVVRHLTVGPTCLPAALQRPLSHPRDHSSGSSHEDHLTRRHPLASGIASVSGTASTPP